MKPFTKLKDWFLDHHWVSSCSVTLIPILMRLIHDVDYRLKHSIVNEDLLQASFSTIKNNLDDYMILLPLFGLASSFGALAVRRLRTLFHSDREAFLKGKHLEYAEKTGSGLSYFAVGYEEKDEEKSFEFLKKGIDNYIAYTDEKPKKKIDILNSRKTFIDAFTDKFIMEKKFKKEKLESFKDYINLALKYFMVVDNKLKAIDLLNEAQELFPDSKEIYFFQAFLIEKEMTTDPLIVFIDKYLMGGRKHDSKEKWRKGLELLLNEPEKKFNKIIESRNEVLEYSSKFLSDILVFKRGKNKEELFEGFLVNLFLNEISKEDFLKLVKPLHFFDLDHAYSISVRKPLQNLNSLFEKEISDEKKIFYLKGALINQSRLHSLTKDYLLKNSSIKVSYLDEEHEVILKDYNYSDTLNRRLFSRLGYDKSAENLLNELLKILGPYQRKEFSTLINSDLALTNILEDSTILDLEKKAFGNPVIDAVSSLEDPLNENINRKELFLRFYSGFDICYLFDSYDSHALFVSLCQVGSKINQGSTDKAEFYLKNALLLAQRYKPLEDSLIKYFRNLKMNFANLL